MTLPAATPRSQTAGDGTVTAFTFPYLFFADDDLTVILVVNATGVETTQTLTTHYTVAGAGVAAGGTVTMVTAPAVGETLVVWRQEQFVQGLDLVENDPFPSDSVEQALDSLTMLAQQVNTAVIRSVKLSDGDTSGVNVTLPTPVATAFIKFSADGLSLETALPATIGDATLPGSSIDNTLPRFTGTTGTALQGSLVTVDDNALLSAPGGLGFAKGGDITSASPLVIDTDGGMFDVTGTTGFSAMTVAVGRLFILQFDGALVMTHGAGTLDLGGSNITTAAGDAGIFYATAANVVRLVGWVKVGNVAYLANDNVWAGAQRTTVTALTSSSNSMAITLGSSNDFSHTFTEATTLANPADTAVPGQKGTIYLTQHASSPKTLAYGSEYDFAGGTAITVTAANSARDSIDYVVRADGKIELSGLLNLS
tara:strand:+ start:30 stop:1304 length:1275 start_codon:yes stop_codon:yes gene_type:complete